MPDTFYPASVVSADGAFDVSFPDFPGLSVSGRDLNEVATVATSLLAARVEEATREGGEIPDPTPLPMDAPGATLLIGVTLPVRTARVLISIDENLLKAVDAVAGNRSAFFADAARQKLKSA